MSLIQYLICFGFGAIIAKSVINEDWVGTAISAITGLLYCVSISIR